jgi:hypothetical protein
MAKRRKFVKTNIPGYEKHVRTNVIINKDNGDYASFVKAREKSRKFRDLEQTVRNQATQIDELREMVLKLLEKE